MPSFTGRLLLALDCYREDTRTSHYAANIVQVLLVTLWHRSVYDFRLNTLRKIVQNECLEMQTIGMIYYY